ncbi:hypothetical protein C8T65DRAFT_751478 [Cerioporus squamosus]|nr:hypothetical protein C8T65DRAFT_751478 [Cerioporus squamosus]
MAEHFPRSPSVSSTPSLPSQLPSWLLDEDLPHDTPLPPSPDSDFEPLPPHSDTHATRQTSLEPTEEVPGVDSAKSAPALEDERRSTPRNSTPGHEHNLSLLPRSSEDLYTPIKAHTQLMLGSSQELFAAIVHLARVNETTPVRNDDADAELASNLAAIDDWIKASKHAMFRMYGKLPQYCVLGASLKIQKLRKA